MIIANYKIKVVEDLIIDTEKEINEQLEQDTIGKGINEEIPKMIFIGIMKKADLFKKIIRGNNAKKSKNERKLSKNSNKNKNNQYKPND